MDEHGEINVLLFSGLTAHNGSNEVVAGLAESWEYDESACTYTTKTGTDMGNLRMEMECAYQLYKKAGMW